MKILLDMDEVITDFVGGACRAWGVDRAIVETDWRLGLWDIVPPLAKQVGCGPMSQDQFWTRLNGSEDFWLGLGPLPWAKEVVKLVSSHTDDWLIVTAPSRCHYSYSAKVKWLKRFFGERFDRFAITAHKSLFAGPGKVLIDDRDSNVEEFRRAGGQGIVFPAYHNSQHEYRHDPVAYLAKELEQLCT